jgi:hypothetical protein
MAVEAVDHFPCHELSIFSIDASAEVDSLLIEAAVRDWTLSNSREYLLIEVATRRSQTTR